MITRRGFIGYLGASSLYGVVPEKIIAASRTRRNSVVVLDEIGPKADAEYLRSVLLKCAAAGIPVTCLVEPHATGLDRLDPSDPVSKVLREAKTNFGGLIELCPFIGNLGELTPYFQARAAFEAKQQLERAIWEEKEPVRNRPARLVGCRSIPDAIGPGGLRSAGIRTVLARPERTAPIHSEAWDAGVVRIVGGVRLGAANRGVPREIETASEQIFYVSVGETGRFDLKAPRFNIDTLISAVRPQQGNGWRSPVLAADVALRDAYNHERLLSFHILNSETGVNLTPLHFLLTSSGVPFTSGPSFQQENSESPREFWLRDSPSPGSGVRPDPEAGASFFRTETRETQLVAGDLRQVQVALCYGDHADCAGLDSSGTLRMPTLLIDSPEGLIDLTNEGFGTDDLTVVLNNSFLASEHANQVMKSLLLSLRSDGFTQIVSIDEQARKLFPTSASISHHRRTAAYKRAKPAKARSPVPSETKQLLADARLAWSYFEKWTNTATGLCPATVHQNGGTAILHEAVTMWDVGSHINALIAAHKLDLISERDFRNAVEKLLPNLAGRRSQGRLLPQGWIVTNRIKWGVKDFDGCDAGRLLSSLYNLDKYGVAGKVAEPVVRSWDLQTIIRDGIIHSVKNEAMLSTYKSHCTHYAAWAFRLWGMATISPYEVDLSDVDREMALIEAASIIGPLGAEPLLLEALELEMSPESAFLADTLFAAQLEERRETGMLTCVSESPIDRAPWFIYSGLDLDKPGRVWATDTVQSLPEHRTPEFADENMTISSKAAYLWLAYNQHDYSSALVHYVREKASTKYGFNSGIYRSSGQATRNTDLNTNAIILQSIARVLTAET